MITDCLRRLLALARVRDWLFSKVLFTAGASLLLAPDEPLAAQAFAIASVVALGAFGYSINEVADLASDLRAGRANRAVGLPRWISGVFLAVCGIAAAVLGLFASPPVAHLALMDLLLAAQYSRGPFRFKEQGLIGIAVAAAAQWMIPVLMIASVKPPREMALPDLLLVSLAMFIGIRWMGIHQYLDVVSDRVAGVRTFASMGGGVTRLVRAAFLMEVLLLVGLARALRGGLEGQVFVATLVLWGVSGVVMPGAVTGFGRRLMGYARAPLGVFYFKALPGALLVQRVFPELPPWMIAAAMVGVLRAVGLLESWKRRSAVASVPSGGRGGSCPAEPVASALRFLGERQLETGEIVVLRGRDPKLSDGIHPRIVFGTAMVSRILQEARLGPAADRIVAAANRFLIAEREESGVWRYFGKGSLIPADVDDTAYCLMALGPAADGRVIEDVLLRNVDEAGRMRTWLTEPGAARVHRAVIDAAVNANVLTLLRSRGVEASGLAQFLKAHLAGPESLKGSWYYPSPFFFLQAIAGSAAWLSPESPGCVVARVRELLQRDPGTDVLNLAMAATALARCGGEPAELAGLRRRIREAQWEDGGWEAVGLFVGVEDCVYWYGSRELTTAFCLEAILPEHAGQSGVGPGQA